MHEVKVYDSSGILKKVISINALKKRDQLQIDNPSIFSKNKRFGRIGGGTAETPKIICKTLPQKKSGKN